MTDIEIPEEISALPNVEGFGNVHNLHTAMALDDSGELKSLVEQYISATDLSARESILLDLIYTWAGVIDIDPFSRSISSSVNPIGDARKLETLERFLGEKYVGIWCTGTRDPNPHRHAAPILLDAFEQLKNYIDGVLLSQTHYKAYVDSIIIEWDEESLQWNVNVSEVLGMLESAFNEQGEGGASFVSTFGKVLTVSGDIGKEILNTLASSGDLDGTAFEVALAVMNLKDVGTLSDDVLNGTDGDDDIYGLAGNDLIRAGNGNDTLTGGLGNDHLIGGEGADTYIFSAGFGHGTIDNTHTDNASDAVLFKEGLSPENAVLSRDGYDLLISFDDNNSLRIFSYFDARGETSAVVDTIRFSDTNETTWHFSDIVAMTGVADGSDNFHIGTDGADTYDGLGGDDIVFGGDGNDVLSGGDGQDVLYGENGDDVLDGGAGDDLLYGGSGSDTYKFGRGYGKDTIIESDANESDIDEILLNDGITANDICVSRDDANLYISIYGSDEDPTIYDILTVQGYYKNEHIGEMRLRFSDGTVWNDLNEHVTLNTGVNTGMTLYGSGMDDTISGTDGDDIIDGNAGDDTLSGGAGKIGRIAA